jgi:hypothetical protein
MCNVHIFLILFVFKNKFDYDNIFLLQPVKQPTYYECIAPPAVTLYWLAANGMASRAI